MIGIDTFSIQKLLQLRHSGWDSVIDNLLDQGLFFITSEGEKEFRYWFKNDLFILEKFHKFPILNEKLNEYIKIGFDINDASLLEYSDIMNYRIISEDRPMVARAVSAKNYIIFLIDFFYEIYIRDDFFSQREFYHLVKLFRNWRNIKEKKAKKLIENKK